jgi:hypothetical protein
MSINKVEIYELNASFHFPWVEIRTNTRWENSKYGKQQAPDS